MLLLFFLCLGLLNPTSLIGCLWPEHIEKGGPRPAAQLLKSWGSLVQKSQGLRQRPGLAGVGWGAEEDREGEGRGRDVRCLKPSICRAEPFKRSQWGTQCVSRGVGWAALLCPIVCCPHYQKGSFHAVQRSVEGAWQAFHSSRREAF